MDKMASQITKLIKSCYDELDLDKKIELLHNINSLLSVSYQIRLPSLFTDDYIDIALYEIERRVNTIQNGS
jgi:hypothetical protein